MTGRRRWQEGLGLRERSDLDRFYRLMLAERRGDGQRRYSTGSCEDYRTYMAQVMTPGGMAGVTEPLLGKLRSAIRKYDELMGDEGCSPPPDDTFETWKARRDG